MLLSELAEAIRDIVNNAPEKTWPDAKVALDYVTCLSSSSEMQVIVTPELVQMQRESSQGRRRIVKLHEVLLIHLIVGKGFEDLPTNEDVAPWDECKEILDIHHKIQRYVMFNWPPGLTLVDAEPQPVDEQQLDHRNFNVFTTFGYEQFVCDSGQE